MEASLLYKILASLARPPVAESTKIHSYISADILITREGRPSKGGAFAPRLPPLDPPLARVIRCMILLFYLRIT